MKFGAHVSVAGGIDKAPSRASLLGCECFQIFTRPPQGGKPPQLDRTTVDAFLEECQAHNFTDYYVHTPYYINIASAEKRISSSSVSTIREEMERGSIIGAKYIVTHLGSTKGSVKSEGFKRVIEGLKQILDSANHPAELLIENSAGQGEIIGSTFSKLAEIIDGVGNIDLGICLDTALPFCLWV
jgi:apurinic endonuclease (APN1)